MVPEVFGGADHGVCSRDTQREDQLPQPFDLSSRSFGLRGMPLPISIERELDHRSTMTDIKDRSWVQCI
jgi:hypothetical protein